MRKLLFVFCLVVFPAVPAFCQETTGASEGSSVYKYQQTQDLVSLVKDAASAIAEKGETVFPEFKKKTASGGTAIAIFLLSILTGT